MDAGKSVKMVSMQFYKALVYRKQLKDMNYKGTKEFLIVGKSTAHTLKSLIMLLDVESLNGKYKDTIVYRGSKDDFNSINIGSRVINLSIITFDKSDGYYIVQSKEKFTALIEVKNLINFWLTHLILNFGLVVLVIILLYNVVFWSVLMLQ